MKTTNIIKNSYIHNHTSTFLYTENFALGIKETLELHGHEFLEIGITLSGSSLHSTGGQSQLLTPGSVYIIPVGTTHEASHFKHWKVRNIYLLPTVFSANFLNTNFSAYYKLQNFLMRYGVNASEALCFDLSTDVFQAICSIFNALNPSLFSNRKAYEIFQNQCLVNILLLLTENFYTQKTDDVLYLDPRLIKIGHFIQEHLELPLKDLISELADSFSLNAQYINRIVKKNLGIPISRYIMQCKIENSIQLLASGASPADVAFSLGFYDYSHFHKYFTKHVGIPPKTYQERLNLS